MAGPFKTVDRVGAVQFSPDSKKLAVKSSVGKCLDVWDVQSQKLDVRIGQSSEEGSTDAPVFWTNKNKNILTAFSFDADGQASTIYEFDASTLKTVGTALEHTYPVNSLALLFDDALVISAYNDATIKLWAFESRQLLASYGVGGTVVHTLMPSPDSLQLAYTTYGDPDTYIFNVTPALLSIQSTLRKTDTNLLNSDATCRPTVVRRTPAKRPVISSPPRPRIHSPTIDHQQPIFLRRVRKLFQFSSRTNSVPPVQPRDPWDFPATLPLPPNHSASPQVATQFDHFEISSPPRRSNRITQFLRQGLPFRRSGSQSEPPVVEVAPGRKFTRLAAAKFPEYRKVDDTRHPSRQQTTAQAQGDPTSDSSDIDSLPDVHWVKALLCYYSCWSHGRLRKPPRWRLERVDIPRQDGTTSSS
ncbi:Quino protein amine dehydrogenase [Suillus subaureus]|uniref:Quino protein amine dehydrogenase n=1 Tax=Suillus subaureus TaxID=48587 RepID=A0A9P7J6W2_9AGAM|nr:Quino protein amine dehydrogenase [Suillus subaureus]KAG1805667.1 Quino protein amine dehydrogenase [Suillus subaureus]